MTQDTRLREREQFLADYQVSHETASGFDRYEAMLIDWQTRMNLVAPSTLPHIWQRHFADSAQLFALVPPASKILLDIGSGAGFPGLVIALLAKERRPQLEIHVAESVQKKVGFLQAISNELQLRTVVHPVRSETLRLRADCITARALAALPDLFRLSQNLLKPDGTLLFLKGAKAADELTAARKNWHFDCKTMPSRTEASGTLLLIRNLHYRQEKPHDRARSRR